MEKVRYMISDAASMAGVETHVLRYWEDELDLTIPRNEMGHRYYTKENIDEFLKIKELKEKGYQLKAIRAILHNGSDIQPENGCESKKQNAMPMSKEPSTTKPVHTTSSVPQIRNEDKPVVNELSAEERMAQFRELMSDIVGRAIAQNNEELSLEIGQEVKESILKEMNYLFREQDETQEERYKKLDEAIRGKLRSKHSLFSKKEKEKTKSKKDKTHKVGDALTVS